MTRVAEILMRSYTGLFSFPVPIDEDYVAGKAGVTVPELRQLLYRMSLEHVIRYIPADHATIIYLHEDRLMPKNVKLTPERHERLKSTYMERMTTMIDYVNESDTCRSRYLLAYFGQTESTDCGTCDVCRAAGLGKRQPEKMQDRTGASDAGERNSADGKADVAFRRSMSEYIVEEKSGSYTLEDINARYGSPSADTPPDYLDTLRDLIDEGSVPPYMP